MSGTGSLVRQPIYCDFARAETDLRTGAEYTQGAYASPVSFQ